MSLTQPATSDTPRTDKAVADGGNYPWVPVIFARQLERELAEKRTAPLKATTTCEHDWSCPTGFITKKCIKCNVIERIGGEPVWRNADKFQPLSGAKVLIWPGRYGRVSVGWYEHFETGGVWHDATEQISDEGSHLQIDVQFWMNLPPEPMDVPRRETLFTISWQW